MLVRELRAKSELELKQLEMETQESLARLRITGVGAQSKNVGAIRNARRTIARIKTVQRERIGR